MVETDRPSLAALPVLRCWPGDGGRYITLPMVFTRDPVTGARNVGMYRLQVYDDQTLGMHWQIHKGSAEHQRLAEERAGAHGGGHRARRRPVRDLLGLGAPAAGHRRDGLRGLAARRRACRWCRARRCDVDVPAEAEIVLEGWVDPAERRLEGPFGDHTGYYSLARDYPVFHLKAITRRKNPIYPTTIVGRPPQEDYWLGKATERIFLPIIRLMLPEIVDMNMPAEGVFHNLVIVSIKKRYPGHARKVMYALWGLGLMMLAKNIVVVSEHVNVHDLSEVAWRATGNIDPRRDLVIVDGPMDDLDHAALRHRFGGKLGHRRHREDGGRRHRAALARRDRDERRHPRARHAALGRVRALGPRPARARPPPLPRRDQVRAHRLRPALRLRGDGAGGGRLARLARRWSG